MFVSTFRLVFRTPGAWQLANSYVILNCTNNLQAYQCYHGINHINKEPAQKGIFDAMELNRKTTTGTSVWRKMSTQSSPNKESSVEEVGTESTNIVSIKQGKSEIGEGEAVVVSPSSTDLDDVLKDSNDVSGNSLTASAAQNFVRIQDAEKITIQEKSMLFLLR